MTHIVSLGSILFAFIWALKVERPLTQRVTAFLAFSSLLPFDSFIGLAPYSFYFITFASILAGIEPGNSLNLKSYQKNFFLVTSFVFVLFALQEILKFPFTINKGYFGFLYLLSAAFIVFEGFKKVNTRLGVIVIWAGYAFNWVLSSFF